MTFTTISLNKALRATGALQWNGSDLVVQGGNTLYDVSISGSSGTVIGTTNLRRHGGGLASTFDGQIFAPDYNAKAREQVSV